MANYAYVQDNEIKGLYDSLPVNWKNISNFYIFTDEQAREYGWKKIIKPGPLYNTETEYVGNVDYYLLGEDVYERYQILTIPVVTPPSPEEIFANTTLQWELVRKTRDEKMSEFEWRYSRYDRQLRLGLETVDTIENMDAYMQALADVTLQSDPFSIVWPEYVG